MFVNILWAYAIVVGVFNDIGVINWSVNYNKPSFYSDIFYQK